MSALTGYQSPFSPHAGIAAPPSMSMSDAQYSEYQDDPRIASLCQELGMSPYFAAHVGSIKEYSQAHLFVDDSWSTEGGPMAMIRQMSKLALGLWFDIREGATGTKAYSLTKEPKGRTVTSYEDMEDLFVPCGFTPTVKVMGGVLTGMDMSDGKHLTVLFTDGSPDEGFDAFRDFIEKTQNDQPNSYIQVVVASTKTDLLDRYNKEVDGIPRVDVCSWIPIERNDIQKHQGPNFSFTDTDWASKCLLGPEKRRWGRLDQEKFTDEELSGKIRPDQSLPSTDASQASPNQNWNSAPSAPQYDTNAPGMPANADITQPYPYWNPDSGLHSQNMNQHPPGQQHGYSSFSPPGVGTNPMTPFQPQTSYDGSYQWQQPGYLPRGSNYGSYPTSSSPGTQYYNPSMHHQAPPFGGWPQNPAAQSASDAVPSSYAADMMENNRSRRTVKGVAKSLFGRR